MQFLVKVTSRLPPDFPQAERSKMLSAEIKRVQELQEQGKLIAVWKVPLTSQSITLWEVQDAMELHLLFTSLPAAAWGNATVFPLVQRNLMPH